MIPLIKSKAQEVSILFPSEGQNVMHIRKENFIKYSELILSEGKTLGMNTEHAMWVLSRLGQEIEDPDQYKHHIVTACADLFEVDEKSEKGYYIGSRIYKHFGIK